MGRHPWSRRQMVEDCKVFSILDPDIKANAIDLYKDGFFAMTIRDANGTVLNQQDIHIRKSGIFGKTKFRLYLSCPFCHENVTKLYRPSDDRFYACRLCHDLTYRSQKKRYGSQEKWLMNFGIPVSRRMAWEWFDLVTGRKKGLP